MIIRMTLEKQIGDMHMRALILGRTFHESGPLLGVIKYDNQPNQHVAISHKHPLECAVSSNPPGWKDFLRVQADCPEEWLTEATTLCLFREEFSREHYHPQPITPQSFLALEFLNRLYGMIYQKTAVAEAGEMQIFLSVMEQKLRHYFDHKRSKLASLCTGLD